MAIIQLENVKKSYGKHQVLKGVNLEVEKGEIYGLLGPNGAGKTTLFQTMLGLLQPDSGEISINGRSNQSTKEVKRDIGYLPSDISFYEDLTARQNLRFFADLADKEPDFDHLLELVGLTDDADRNVGDFSTGMKKRLGIAQSLIKDPEIAIYDEPTTGLDPKGKNEFRQHVEKINEEKDVTVIISSHITGEISPLCDRFGILAGGMIAASGTKEELGEKTGSKPRLNFETAEPEKAVDVFEDRNCEYRQDGKHFEVSESGKEDLLKALIDANVDIRSFTSDKSTLESTYLELTK